MIPDTFNNYCIGQSHQTLLGVDRGPDRSLLWMVYSKAHKQNADVIIPGRRSRMRCKIVKSRNLNKHNGALHRSYRGHPRHTVRAGWRSSHL